MKIYLDVCCLNRPFDDQRQPRVRMESEAVTLVFEHIDAGRHQQVSLQVAEIEIAAITEPERRRRVHALLPPRKDRIRLTQAIFARAESPAGLGFKSADALHIACAEAAGADIFLSCDDRLCRLGRRVAKHLGVTVANPLQWIPES